MSRFLLVGEAMGLFTSLDVCSVRNAENFNLSVCGAELNVAVGLKRLGHEVSYLTRVGDDFIGEKIISFLKKENISTADVRICPNERTGYMFKGKTLNGDPDIAYCRAGSAASRMDEDMLEDFCLENYDVLHITGITPALNENCRRMCLALMKKAREKGLFVSFDPNLRLMLWESTDVMRSVIHRMAGYADLFLPGISEARILCERKEMDECLRYYADLGIGKIAIKNGAAGADYFDSGIFGHADGFKVENIVDTVGAGDGFAAGLLASLFDGYSFHESVIRANGVGAMQLLSPSDNEGLPTVSELEDFIESHK